MDRTTYQSNTAGCPDCKYFPKIFIVPAIFIILTGCSPLFEANKVSPALPVKVRIESFPFFEQDNYHCAPAAAAMILTHLGSEISPNQLAESIYTPGEKGAYQNDLITALRRQGKIVYKMESEINTLLSHVSAHSPVIVLLNLGFNWFPRYHYVVVTGYNLESSRIVFTSGRKEEEVISIDTFLRMWKRAGNWGILVLNPGVVPEYAVKMSFLQAVAGLEQAGFLDHAEQSYKAALLKWGSGPEIFLALGNIALGREQYEQAVISYEKALDQYPDSTIIRNNYAWALAHAGQLEKAHSNILQAIEQDSGECGNKCKNTLDFITRSHH